MRKDFNGGARGLTQLNPINTLWCTINNQESVPYTSSVGLGSVLKALSHLRHLFSGRSDQNTPEAEAIPAEKQAVVLNLPGLA